MNKNFKFSYRQDIDGLRAYSIIAVIGFHCFPDYFPGGFIGVDIFFVISGYLIGKILFYEIESGNFSYLNFASRRIRRILPSLLFVLLMTMMFGWFLMLSDEYRRLNFHIGGAVLFLTNFLLLNEHGYFDIQSNLKPLLHLWSLAIEEQFYIIFPITLFIANKLKLNLFKVTATLGALSFLLNIDQFRRGNSAFDFYSPQTRFWELMLGALLGYLDLKGGAPFKSKHLQNLSELISRIFINHATPLGVSSIALMTFSVFLISDRSIYPGIVAIAPVFGAVFFIAVDKKYFLKQSLFSNSLMAAIGKISFPLYLWHWPILVIFRLTYGDDFDITVKLFSLFLTIFLSIATYFLIEKPIKKINSKAVSIPIIFIALLIGLASVSMQNIREQYQTETMQAINKIQQRIGERAFPAGFGPDKFINKGDGLYYMKSGALRTTLFLGDSNVMQYMPRVIELIQKNGDKANNAFLYSYGGCPPIQNLVSNDTDTACRNLITSALNFISNDKTIDTVVIAANWVAYFEDKFYFIDDFGAKESVELGGKGYIDSLNRLNELVKQLKAMGHRVVLVSNIPTGVDLNPAAMIRRNLSDFPNVFELYLEPYKRNSFEAQYFELLRDMRKIAIKNNAIIVEPIDYLCGPIYCPALDDSGNPKFSDSTHLNPHYVKNHFKLLDFTMFTNSDK